MYTINLMYSALSAIWHQYHEIISFRKTESFFSLYYLKGIHMILSGFLPSIQDNDSDPLEGILIIIQVT